METPTMGEILAKTKQLVTVKQAQFEDKTAKGLDTSGAGDDSPKTRGHAMGSEEAALEPTKKPLDSADANAEPPSDGSGTAAGGAPGADDSEMTRGHTVGSEEAVDTPKKIPAESDEAMNVEHPDKTASLANEILSDIRSYQKQASSCCDKCKKAEGECKCGSKKADDASADTKDESKDDTEGEAEGKVKTESTETSETPADEGKEASESPAMELTGDVLAKVAAIMLSTEEGADLVEKTLAKEAGAEMAQETLAFLAQQSELAEKEAAYAQGSADAESMILQSVYEQGAADMAKQAGINLDPDFEKGASDAENLIAQLAAQQRPALTPFQKLGQEVADASMADLMGGAEDGEMAVSPEEMGAPMGGGEEMGGEMGEEGVSPEELEAALAELVQEGEIAPEEAQAVSEYIAGGGEAGGEAGGEEMAGMAPPAADEGGEEVPDEGGEDMEAQAAAKTAQALLTAIQNMRK